MENPEEFTCQLIQKGVAQDLNGNNQDKFAEKIPQSISTGYSGSESLSSEVSSVLINSQDTSLGFSEDYSSSISSMDHNFISTMVSHFILPAVSHVSDSTLDAQSNGTEKLQSIEENNVEIREDETVCDGKDLEAVEDNPDLEASEESRTLPGKYLELAVEVYHSDSEINEEKKICSDPETSGSTSSSSCPPSPEPSTTLSKWSSQQKLIIVVDENQKKDPATQITTACDTNTTIITISTTSTTTTTTSQMASIRPENANDEVTITSNSNASKFVSRVDIDTDKIKDEEGNTELDVTLQNPKVAAELHENDEGGNLQAGGSVDPIVSNSEPSFAQSLLQYFLSCIPCNRTVK